MNLLDILADAYRFYIGNLRQMVALFLPILLIVSALEQALTVTSDATSVFWVALVNLLFYPLYTGPLLQLLARRTQHETPSNAQLLSSALRFWWPLLALTFLVGAMVAFGLMLLIIPGIWIAVRLSFAEIYLVVEGLGPLAALRKSHDTTKELFWVILLAIAGLYALLIGLSEALVWMVDTYGGGDVWSIVSETLVAFLGLFVNVVIFRIYLLNNLRQAQA